MTPYFADEHLTVYHGDAREVMSQMEAESVHCVVSSPPYWGLRDYGEAGQLGLEPTPEEYVANMVAVFREVRRVLRADGTVWLNLGDSYASHDPGGYREGEFLNPGGKPPVKQGPARNRAGNYRPSGLKPKDLVGIPWRVAFALQSDGWYLRSDVIWAKPNPMPESVTDRPTKSHEYLFLLAKSQRYYFDAAAVREPSTTTRPELLEFGDRQDVGLPDGRTDDRRRRKQRVPAGWDTAEGGHVTTRNNGRMPGPVEYREAVASGRNIRSVWTIATQPYPGAHFATFPPKLVEPCVKAGCPEGGVVLDPFAGSGTTGMVAQALGRRAVLIDLSMDYLGQLMARNAQKPLGLR